MLYAGDSFVILRKRKYKYVKRGRKPPRYTVVRGLRLTAKEDMAFRTACLNIGITYTEALRRMVLDLIGADHRRRERNHLEYQVACVEREAKKRGESIYESLGHNHVASRLERARTRG